ncbi:heterokaryon incompatibility protein-domain-containing protein [Xylogone sp. PMI_703]|nr:heterokaryon incompatibility protein-domain-containing protein [Xylogone sp. PMI_703]
MGYSHYFTVCGWDTDEWQMIWPKLVQDVRLVLEAVDVLIDRSIVDTNKGIYFNGVADEGHETFFLGQSSQKGSIKTLRKPYDLVVACVLLRAYLLAPNNFRLRSDGEWDEQEWVAARQLYEELWQGEPIWCPWDDNGDGNIPATIPKENTESTVLSTGGCSSVIDISLDNLQLSPPLSSPLESTTTISGVDFSFICQWLSQCEEDPDHIECKAAPNKWPDLPGAKFKLIDIQRRCIVDAPENVSFVALSYVWGGVEQPRLCKATMPLFMHDKGLDDAWSQIPTTIRDAITLCEHLGERYLWVDALCITQDSTRDMKLQIVRMRQIYSSAKVTIVGVSAATAGTGLLGGPLSSMCESEAALNTLMDSSPWGSRAWCYQEKVLSHRLILFTFNGIYMQCQKGTWRSDGTQLLAQERQSIAKFNAVGGMLSLRPDEELESFISAVEYYSQRKLTKQEDKKNAFEGILRRYGGKIDGKKSSFYFGLPICAFDQAICWRIPKGSVQLRNAAFPSWSWLGWSNAVSFDRKLLETSQTCQMVYNPQCYFEGIENTRELRKPVSPMLGQDIRFGFPSSVGIGYDNSPFLILYASLADLYIASDPVESDGPTGLYSVFPSKSNQRSLSPTLKMIDLYDMLEQKAPPMLLSMIDEIRSTSPASTTEQTIEVRKVLNEAFPWLIEAIERAEAPSVSAATSGAGEYTSDKPDTEINTPVGYIWLNREWREKQPRECVKKFMALAGEKDPEREGWIVSMAMCLEAIEEEEEDRFYWAAERVQVMDCQIDDRTWRRCGAQCQHVRLV